MPGTYPFTAGLRVLCEQGLLEHRFVAGAGDEVADSDVVSVLTVYPRAGEPREHSVPGDDPWRTEIEAFLDCVERGGGPGRGHVRAGPRGARHSARRAALVGERGAGEGLKNCGR